MEGAGGRRIKNFPDSEHGFVLHWSPDLELVTILLVHLPFPAEPEIHRCHDDFDSEQPCPCIQHQRPRTKRSVAILLCDHSTESCGSEEEDR